MSTMWFEGRELPTFSGHYPASHLREGEIYYSVSFIDKELLIPELEPKVFIGRDLASGDHGFLYFQDVSSYSNHVRYGTPSAGAVFDRYLESQSSGVFDYEGALNELMRCSLRRQEAIRST